MKFFRFRPSRNILENPLVASPGKNPSNTHDRNHVIMQVLIIVLCHFDVDSWHLMLKPEKIDVEMIEPSDITGNDYSSIIDYCMVFMQPGP